MFLPDELKQEDEGEKSYGADNRRCNDYRRIIWIKFITVNRKYTTHDK